MSRKSFGNTTASHAKDNVPDIQFWGTGDMWRLICKAWSKSEGWMKSTKAMDVGVGVVMQVTTQQQNDDGSYSIAEAVTFIPGVAISEKISPDGVVVARTISKKVK